MIIKKVMESKHTKQKTVTVPKDSGIEKGDYVMITKVKGEQEKALAEKNLSALAKTNTKSANQTLADKINEDIRK